MSNEKNWINPHDIYYQEEQPHPDHVAIEDIMQEEMQQRWERMVANTPLWAPLTMEMLNRMKDNFFAKL